MRTVTFTDIIGNNGVFIDGDWVESKDQNPNGEVRLLQLADIGDGYFINKSNRFLTLESAKKLKCTFLEAGDILVARMPDPLGRACIFPGLEKPCVTVVDVCIIRPDKEFVSIEWLKFLINSIDYRNTINKFITGTTRQRISRGNLAKLSFRLPPLQDQIRIAEILTQAENLITQRKKSILLLDELLKSTFLEMFGDNSYPINTIENISLNIVDCPHSTPKYQDSISDYPCIRTSEIKNGKIDWTSMKYTNYEGYLQRVERLVPQAGDIIFAREGSVGDAAIIPQNITLSLGQRVMLFRINPEYAVAEYFWSLIKSDKIQQIIKSKSIGATVSRINMSEVRKIPCPIPPIELQNKFANIVEKVDVLKSNYEASLKELENMYGVLSQKAFKGELNLKKLNK